MHPVFLILLAMALVAALLYATWRVRYGHPPAAEPQVLCYHKVSRRFCWEGTWVTPRQFFATVDRLVDRGYRFVGEDEYLAAVGSGSDVGRKLLFLTFDDAYAGVRSEAFEGLAARSVPFHVFVVTGYVGRTNDWEMGLGRRAFRHATWEEIREMASAGVTFGSHGATHRDLTRLDASAVSDEMVRSKRAIEDAIGVRVKTMSYPFGRYNDAVVRAAEGAGYDAAFSLYPRHSNDKIERFALRRNGVYIIDPPCAVQAKVSRHRLHWFEEMKCRAINGVAVVTPLVKNR